jgi:hypothetical protein
VIWFGTHEAYDKIDAAAIGFYPKNGPEAEKLFPVAGRSIHALHGIMRKLPATAG